MTQVRPSLCLGAKQATGLLTQSKDKEAVTFRIQLCFLSVQESHFPEFSCISPPSLHFSEMTHRLEQRRTQRTLPSDSDRPRGWPQVHPPNPKGFIGDSGNLS